MYASPSSAILSDVTSPATRSKALAHVGIAFAICFCIGPPIGAYFATRPMTNSLKGLGLELNVYAVPAILTLILLVVETLFLAIALPETRGKGKVFQEKEEVVRKEKQGTKANGKTNGHSNGSSKPVVKRTIKERISLLKSLRKLHFFFLALFSGVEFTLTFLTFDRELSSSHPPYFKPINLSPNHSIRLVKHPKRQTYRLNRHHQCPPPRRIRPTLHVQSRRGQYGASRRIKLCHRPPTSRPPPSVHPARPTTNSGYPTPPGICSVHGIHIRNRRQFTYCVRIFAMR